MLEVLTPAQVSDLTTLDAVKAELSVAGLSEDAWLQARIREASGIIADHCRTVFGTETLRETFRADNRHSDVAPEELVLQRLPVASVTSIVEDGTTLATTDWERSGAILYRLRDDERFPWFGRKTVVTYVAGYTLVTDLPVGVERACIVTVAGMYRTRGADRRVRSESVDGIGSTSFFDPDKGGGMLPSEAIEALRPYRMPQV